jgi:hypothetical protein
MKNLLYVIIGIVIILTLMFAVPLALIWSLNVLFPVLAIPFTWKTWLAAFIILWAINPTVKIRSKI